MDHSESPSDAWVPFNPIEEAVKRSLERNDVTPFVPGSEGRIFLVHAPALIRHVLVEKSDLFVEDQHPFVHLGPVLGDAGKCSLLLDRPHQPDGPALSKGRVHEYIVEATSRECSRLGQSDNVATADLSPVFDKLLLQIMGKALFDIDMDDFSERFCQASTSHERYLALSRRGDPKVRQSAELNEMGNSAMKTQDEIVRILLERKLGAGAYAEVAATSRLPKGMSLARAVVRTLLNAYVGTATTLSWLAYALTEHPNIQNELAGDIERVLGSRKVTLEDLSQLPLSRMIVSEVMRLYPTAWMVSRTACAETLLGDVLVPKGSKIFVCIYSLHRDPRYWKDPEQFIPGRFHTSEYGGGAPYSYIPFGAGAHRCVGSQLAMTTLRLMSITIIQMFILGKVPNVSIMPFPRVALRPEPGAIVNFTKRPASNPLSAQQSGGHIDATPKPR